MARPLVPDALRGPAAAVAALTALTVLVLGVRYAGDDSPARVDRHLRRAAVDTADALGSGHRLAGAVTVLGSPAVVAAGAGALALLCLVAGQRRGALLAVAGPGLTGLATTFVKPLVDRTIADSLAYPSGHTGGAASLALVVALLAAGLAGLDAGATALLAVLCTAAVGGAVGVGMVLLGAHYPTDVVGGLAAAVAVVLAVALALDAAARRPARTAA